MRQPWPAAAPTASSRPVPAAAPGGRLVVVSNRIAAAAPAPQMSGGLAVAIEAALQAKGGVWFGWSGEIAADPPQAPALRRAGAVTFATLGLERRDYEEYYAGFANRVLWPLLHFRPDLIDFRRSDYAGYVRVNRLFAQHLKPLIGPGDLVWVHDYHLMRLGEELRRLGAEAPIGFFLHTPFPPGELFRILPPHGELMRALAAYDLAGFQTQRDRDSFLSYFEREPGCFVGLNGHLRAFGRTLTATAFPIGIDAAEVAAQAAQAAASRQAQRLKASLSGRLLMIGVDRLDYSKGLRARFAAFARLFELHPETRGNLTFLQIAPPTRTDVPEYLQIRRELEEETGHINGRFAEFDWTPLRYLNKSFNRRALMGFLRAARIGLVTPLRDGMNLVAKEYVASQDSGDPGVLVLSCFAGAACELDAAVQVNPFDMDAMAEAMNEALLMPLLERRARHAAMIELLHRNSITAWREDFVAALTRAARESA